MKSINRKRTLMVSGAVILLCLTVIVGMTFALFTDTQKVSNHLKAGDLDITLERIALSKTTLTTKGYLDTIDYTDEEAYDDFTNTTDETKNVFDLGENEVIVPGSKFVSTMQITNNSDAAFKYWIKIEMDVEGLTEEQIEALKLDEQLIVTVSTDKDGDGTLETTEDIVANGLKVGDENNPVGILEIKGEGNKYTESFIVSVEFDDLDYTYDGDGLTSDNDVAQLQNVKFDLVVYAVQVTD